MANQELSILKLCFDNVIDLENGRYLVKSDDTWKLCDSNGNIIKSNIDLTDPILSGKLLFALSKFGYMYYMYDKDTLKIIDTEKMYNNITPLKCGATLVLTNNYWGILNPDGEYLAPCIYNWVKVTSDEQDEATVYCIYSVNNVRQSFSIKISNCGRSVNHLLVLTLNDSNTNQICVSSWKESKSNTKSYYYYSYEERLKYDSEQYNFKFKPVYYGNILGQGEYDIIINHSKLMELGYYLVGNKMQYKTLVGRASNKCKYYLGIVNTKGEELIKPDKYISITYMGSDIFLCKYHDDTMEIVKGGKPLQGTNGIVAYNPNNKIPIIEVYTKNGQQLFLGNDDKLHSSVLDALDIYKYTVNGVVYDINKVNMYGKTYIVSNDFSPMSSDILKVVKADSTDCWVKITQ